MSYESILEKLKELSQKEINQKRDDLEIARIKSPNFNPFQFMRTDEDGLSYILKFLLSPTETHGQQTLFLKQFLCNLVKKKDLDARLSEFNEETVNIVVHQQTIEGRYHDIFIETDQWLISIESKLRGAKEQPEQISHYIWDLKEKSKGRKYVMIYLALSEEEPKTGGDKWKSLKDKAIITPEFIRDWLMESEKKVSSPKIRDFIGYFNSFLIESFSLNDGSVSKENKYGIELSNDEFDSVFTKFKNDDFLNSHKNEFTQLVNVVRYNVDFYREITAYCRDKLKEALKEKLQQTSYELDSDSSLNQVNSIYPIYLKPRAELIDKYPSIPFWICYEDQGKGYWGILWYSEERDRHPKLKNIFSKIQIDSGANATPKYPIWKHCSQDYLAFWKDESWVKILDGTLIDEIWKNIQPLVDNKDIIAYLKNQ